MKDIVFGILAHVDAGKTTLSESLLYHTGAIRKKGRVDHQDAFLDFDKQERDRGITIFSKQARFTWKDTSFTLIDTPGHVDFSSEMERALSILDVAVLIINGCDGIQSHSETIWELLKYYQIPTIVFVNKMDISFYSKDKLMNELSSLDSRIIDISESKDALYEQIAMESDEYLEKYLNHELTIYDIQKAFISCKCMPCIFGSALKEENTEKLLDVLSSFTIPKKYPSYFGAKVYKISHEDNKRWVHMKITGGQLKVKEMIDDEKVDQIRIYSGDKFESVQEVHAGEVCCVSGLNHVQVHDGLGYEEKMKATQLSSYMKYRMILPDDCDFQAMLRNLKTLSEEDPQLKISYDENVKEIHCHLMGEVQIEILKNLILDRFHVAVEFDQGSVVFMETISEIVEGIGHFEPLRHYAEVHLLMEPLARGSGLVVDSRCSEDLLAKNWQRLIMTHLEEKIHKGVLTGSPITDMRISLVAGKAHNKHTEGGDFRQATYRAVRQGLRSVKCLLLEPYYAFRLVLPSVYLSKAIFDIESRKGTFEVENDGEMSVITGKGAVRLLRNYQMEVLNYTKGLGKLTCSLSGYEECVDANKVIEEIGYNCASDLDNPADSVFCKNGAGFIVPYNEIDSYMHLKRVYRSESEKYQAHRLHKIDESEVLRVYERTYGPTKTRLRSPKKDLDDKPIDIKTDIKKQCLLVDGYNIIHAWEELSSLAKDNLDAARDRLIDILSSYQGYKKCLLILVFDAYKVKQNLGKMTFNGNIHIVYTKTAQSADNYIESATHTLKNDYQITVATSDALEQLIVSGQGAMRLSAREFEKEVEYITQTNLKEYHDSQSKAGHRQLEKIRDLNNEKG
ncbi:MAG: NYN domain-containing protein [Traorella sp.]